VEQSVLAPDSHLEPGTNSFSFFNYFRQLRACRCGAPSLRRGRVFSFELLLGLTIAVFLEYESRGTHDHTLFSQFLRLSQPGGPDRLVKVKVTLQLTVSQSLCQGIETILGLLTRYYFLSEGCFLKCAFLSLWDALSDERSGLSFVFLSLVIYHYLHQAFRLHVFHSSAIYIQ
jgi:hypothetical protein